ncbi:MAG: hypothetical protein AAF485_33065 [Chloroflexota bacterium]
MNRQQNMHDIEGVFEQIVEVLLATQEGVTLGKMMSSPGLKYDNKVFAFYHKETMCFRLGKAFDPHEMGSKTAQFLSPFKNKPPMKAWFVIDATEQDLWFPLAERALLFTKSL